MPNKLLFFFLLFLCFSTLSAQEVKLSGFIQDTVQNPVAYANVIATPVSGDSQITFAISDEAGRYKLNLQSGAPYKLEITHMGFSKITDTVQLSEDTNRNFVLKESTESLEAVLIKQEMAVIVREDTITYRVDQFKTGEERKLREVLKKLPGVEVDREGNVKVNGKKVTKLLVEGKTFFTGDTKLGVNNIPADAVEEVVALDNYTEVAFLKGLRDSDQLALNIKLKEGKKKFIFGDIEAGGGIEERYLFHPTLFYYSPKTAINFIGDFNNVGQKSFTFKDYINFEGGFTAMLENSNSFSNIYDSDFAQFLNQKDFIYNKNIFGALSLAQQISSELTLDAYSISSKGKLETKTTKDLLYLTEDGLDEERLSTSINRMFFTINKVKLRYQPNIDTDVSYDAVVQTSSGSAKDLIISETPNEINRIETFVDPESLKINQFLEYNKQFSYEHTSTVSANYSYSHSENTKDWLFDTPVFSGIIPFVEDGEFYNLIQNTATKTHTANLGLTHYWVLNNLNHLYPTAGVNFQKQTFGTLDFQELENGDINGFQESGFNNDLDFLLLDYYVGLTYKKKLNNFIFKPELVYHSYHWKLSQFEEEIENENKGALLPKMEIEYEFSSSESLHFNYAIKSSFSDASNYANRLRLTHFNSLFQGNASLENELRQTFSLSYRKFNMYRGLIIHAMANYSETLKSVQSTTITEGIDQISIPIYTELPSENLSFRGSVAKQISDYKLTLSGNLSLYNYDRIINNSVDEFSSKNYGYAFIAETRFDDFPNLELGYQQDFNNFNGNNLDNEFTQINPYVILEYDFSGFIFEADYEYHYYENQNNNQINRFALGNVSLFYNKEDSLWSFEIEANNIFDVRYKNNNSLNQFYVIDQNIFIQPRTILFKVAYKL